MLRVPFIASLCFVAMAAMAEYRLQQEAQAKALAQGFPTADIGSILGAH